MVAKLPLPFEKATGASFQPAGHVSAMSVLPSPLKSPASALASGVGARDAKFWAPKLVTENVPFPFEKATGTLAQYVGPVSATSVLPSPLKSPTSFFAIGSDAQAANPPI